MTIEAKTKATRPPSPFFASAVAVAVVAVVVVVVVVVSHDYS